MKDKNGIEIKTGMIVEITGAYFKSDNGLYFVAHSPGDASWSGSDYSLRKISKRGKVSTAKNRICFWPISVFVSDRSKAAEANRWNKEFGTIEVVSIENMTEVAAYFRDELTNISQRIERMIWDFGENSPAVQKFREIQSHYEAVALSINA